MAVINKILALFFKYPLCSIASISLLIRLIVYLLLLDIAIYPDSSGYIDLARLITHGELAGYTGERSPGYPLLIALSGNLVFITVFFQVIIGIATAIFLYKTLLVLNFSKKSSLIISTLLNNLLVVVFYEAAILTETFTLFFITLIFYLLFSDLFTEKHSWKKTFLLGFLLGYLTLIKPFYIFLPFIIYALYTLKNFSLKRIINQKIIILFFPLLAFLGWSYVNKINTGYFVSTSYFGINIAQNCVYFAEKVPPKYQLIGSIYAKHRDEAIKNNNDVSMSIWYAYDELKQKTGLSFIELSHELTKYSKTAINENPTDYVKQVILSWSDFWKTSQYWGYLNFKTTGIKTAFEIVWIPQRIALRAFKIVFILFIPYHFFRFFRYKKITPEFIITSIILCTSILQAMATFGTNSRFSFPFEFFMVITVLITLKKPIINLYIRFFKKAAITQHS